MNSCERCGGGPATNLAKPITPFEGDLKEFLSKAFWKNLCSSCLDDLQLLLSQPYQVGAAPVFKVDYYIESGNYVFTELFLLRRGFCCRNRCRHCPYGFGKVSPDT